MMRHSLIALVVAVTGLLFPVESMADMKIRIIVDDQVIPATLNDSAAAQRFAELLPLSMNLKDFHGIEKIFDLPSRLPTTDSPKGMDPEIGDLTYYAPWGNLAIFYRDFGYAKGLVSLGHINGDMTALSQHGAINARIERVPQ